MKRIALSVVVGTLLSACVGSGDDLGETSLDLEASGDTAGGASARETCGDWIMISAPVFEAPSLQKLEGVTVCAEAIESGTPVVCGLTNQGGVYESLVPSCQDYRITYELSGFMRANMRIHVGTRNPGVGTRMWSLDTTLGFMGQLGLGLDLTKAYANVSVVDSSGSRLAGASVSISPSSGTAWYMSADGLSLSSTPTMTSSRGLGGIAGANVGAYEVVVTGPNGTVCIAPSQPGSDPSRAAIDGIAGTRSDVMFICR